jgi:hypothetical protein
VERLPAEPVEEIADRLEAFRAHLRARGVRFVEYEEIQRLEEAERCEAERRGVEWFKFATDEEMLHAIESMSPVS